ncbi:putative protein phosphatase 2C [Paratrimastix pyriformis]|uniref:Protein-serine/threonine phosphatase n=1 Tax=Paratrimastix pyriformis TaxID=342808 RepID=A0ABQ8U5L6_9EUKA|nr:putative protein phosphatase 2C [Paratrimastix pyriformis]
MGCGASAANFRNPEAEGLYRLLSEKYQEITQANPKLKNASFLPAINRALMGKRLEDRYLTIDLTGYLLPPIGVQTFAELLKVPTCITGLLLARCGITNEAAQQLCEALKTNHTLLLLDLSENLIGPPGCLPISQALSFNQGLQTLGLSGNPIRAEGLGHLSNFIRTNRTLTELTLSSVGSEDAGIFPLAAAIAENSKLRKLDLSNNLIGLEGGEELSAALQHNTTITELVVERNNMTPPQHQQLAESLRRNGIVQGTMDLVLNNAWLRLTEQGLVRDPSRAGTNSSQLYWLQGDRDKQRQQLPAFVGDLQLPVAIPQQPPPRVRERRLRVGYADTVGRRLSMEDMIVIKRYFRGHEDEDFFAVFDGHGGHDASEFAAENMHVILAQHLDAGQPPEMALRESFIECNNQMMKFDINDGTTAAVSLFFRDHLYIANAGDTRAVLSRGGRAIRLSFDHKADQPDEEARVNALGGFVSDSRVLGTLSVSRALGDFFLHPYVTAEPYITVTEFSPADEFLLLACDGVWDVLSDEMACAIVASEPDPVQSSLKLIDQAFLNGSTDNISVVSLRSGITRSIFGTPPVPLTLSSCSVQSLPVFIADSIPILRDVRFPLQIVKLPSAPAYVPFTRNTSFVWGNFSLAPAPLGGTLSLRRDRSMNLPVLQPEEIDEVARIFAPDTDSPCLRATTRQFGRVLCTRLRAKAAASSAPAPDVGAPAAVVSAPGCGTTTPSPESATTTPKASPPSPAQEPDVDVEEIGSCFERAQSEAVQQFGFSLYHYLRRRLDGMYVFCQLPEEVLFLILEKLTYLPLAFNIARVSRRFRDIVFCSVRHLSFRTGRTAVVKDTQFIEMAHLFRGVNHLDLYGCGSLSPDVLRNVLLEIGERLSYVNLSGCAATEKVLESLVLRCPGLVSLELGFIMASVVDYPPLRPRHRWYYGTNEVSLDAGMRESAEVLPGLRDVMQTSMKQIARLMPRLGHLDLSQNCLPPEIVQLVGGSEYHVAIVVTRVQFPADAFIFCIFCRETHWGSALDQPGPRPGSAELAQYPPPADNDLPNWQSSLDLSFNTLEPGCFADWPVTQLRTLDLTDSGLNDEMLGLLGARCPLLHSLQLGGCKQLSDLAFDTLGRYFPVLQEITMFNGSPVALVNFFLRGSPEALRRNATHLHVLDLSSFEPLCHPIPSYFDGLGPWEPVRAVLAERLPATLCAKRLKDGRGLKDSWGTYLAAYLPRLEGLVLPDGTSQQAMGAMLMPA